MVAEALNIQGKIYDHLCEFEQEKQIWEKILTIQIKVYSANHVALATTHYDYGNLCLRTGEFDKALEHLEESLRITEKSLGKVHPEYFGRLVRLATCLYEQQSYSHAAAKLKDAQSLQRSIFDGSPHPYIARMYQIQSEVDRRLGNFDQALTIIDQAIKMKESVYDREHPSVAEALEVKVKIYHHLGDSVKAKPLIDRALKIRKDRYGESHPEVGRSEHDLGSYYLRLGQYNEAISHFEKAIRITETTFGKTHLEYIERTLHLANARYEKGEYRSALDIVKELDGIIEKTISSRNHYLKARWLFGKAELYRRLGHFGQALSYIDQAIEMRVAIYGDVHPSVAEVLECQGKIYDHQCEFEKEEQIWKKILDIQSRFYTENHAALATTHYDYGNLCMRKGEFDEAQKHIEKSLTITEKSLGRDHSEYFGRLILLAMCHHEQQNYSLALEKMKEARKLQESIFGQSPHPYVARMYQIQSEVDRRLGNFDQALVNIDQAIKMKEVVYDEEHPSVAEALEVKVKIYHHLGDSVNAKPLIDRALKIRKERYGESNPEVGRSEHDLGSYYLRLGQYKEAISHFEKALRITEATFGKAHLEYIERTLHLANALYEKGEYRSALNIVEELNSIIEKTISSRNHYLKARWLFGKAELYRRLGHFEQALSYVDQAIEMRVAIYGNVHPSVAEVLECQGKIYDHLCEFEKEEQVWKRILEIQSRFYPENHVALATTHYDYGNLCLRKGEFDEAQKHIEKSLTITEKSLGRDHSEYFGRLILLAMCHYDQQNYSLAGEKLKEARKLQESIFGQSPHPYVARMYQIQSEVDRQLRNFDQALLNIDRAIAVKEVVYDTEHPSVAEALEVKLAIFLAQFRSGESKELLDRIERIRIKAYGERHPAYSNYQMQLAEYHSILGHFKEAQEILEKSTKTCMGIFASGHPEIIKRKVLSARLAVISSDALTAEKRIEEARDALKERLLTEKSLTVASVLKMSALIKRRQGNFNDSFDELEKALDIETKILGGESPGVIETMIDKVKILIVFYRLEDAESVIERAMKIVEGKDSIYKGMIADLLDQRGILQTYRNEFDQAIESFDAALSIKDKLLVSRYAEYAKLLVDKAVCLRAYGKYNDALKCLEEAQNINNPLFNENHIFFARICLEMGQTYYAKKFHDTAVEHLTDALNIYRMHPRQDLRRYADVLETLGLVYLETGPASKAYRRFGDVLGIKKSIYNSQHLEIAKTLYNEARALLMMVGTGESSGNARESARQKLEEALQICRGNQEIGAVLLQSIETTMSTL